MMCWHKILHHKSLLQITSFVNAGWYHTSIALTRDDDRPRQSVWLSSRTRSSYLRTVERLRRVKCATCYRWSLLYASSCRDRSTAGIIWSVCRRPTYKYRDTMIDMTTCVRCLTSKSCEHYWTIIHIDKSPYTQCGALQSIDWNDIIFVDLRLIKCTQRSHAVTCWNACEDDEMCAETESDRRLYNIELASDVMYQKHVWCEMIRAN